MNNQFRNKIRIGTSNIILPGNKQTFPAKFRNRSRLHYYSTLFNTLEINSCFYKVPMPATFEKWSLEVGEDFQFTLKLWRGITHGKELFADHNNIDQFLQAANRIGDRKKGCLLIQFPGKITLEYYSQLEKILTRIMNMDKEHSWRKAVEFRNPSWYTGETFELLDACGASLVLHDIPKAKVFETNKGAQFIYLRFHGPKGDYRGNYDDAFLREKANLIKGWVKDGKEVYAYFNNSIGCAWENAMTLKMMTR